MLASNVAAQQNKKHDSASHREREDGLASGVVNKAATVSLA